MALSIAQKAGRQTPSRITGSKILMWVALVLTTLISLFPMYWMFVTAFTPTRDTIKTPPDLLPHADFSNFERLFTQAVDYWHWFGNSVLITLGITFFHLIFDTLSGYAFAKKKFPGRNILFWIIISTLMIPPQVTLVPLYIVVQNFSLRDSLWAVILPGWANVFGIFLMRQYIQTLPTELEEAGRIDGCSEPGIFWRIILPLSKPALAALAIFTFVRFWNDFLWPSMVLIKSPSYTLPVGVASLQTEFSTDYGLIFAGSAMAALPMIAFFLAFQKYFLEGVRAGAVKG
jgi:multiple sugar transport system permease protein